MNYAISSILTKQQTLLLLLLLLLLNYIIIIIIIFSIQAVFLYPLSALVYTIGSAFPVDPNYEDDYGDPNSTNAFVSLNLIGAAILFVDAFICIFDWYS